MSKELKDQLSDAFRRRGETVIQVSEMRGHFDDLARRNLGMVQRALVQSANPCSEFAIAQLAQILVKRPDGTLGLYADSKGRVGEHNAYFHSDTLLLVFHTAVDRVKVPPGFRDLQARVVAFSIQAFEASRCHLPRLKSGHLRPVKHPELHGK
jgi:hypothetical protein